MTDLRAGLVAESAVLRHKFAQRRAHPRRPDIIEHYHDTENCQLCALVREWDRLRKIEEAAREARAHLDADEVAAAFVVLDAALAAGGEEER